MTPLELKQLLPWLHNQKFVGMSDDQLLSYAQIYASLYDMVTVNALDEEYGKRDIYAQKLDELFLIIFRRYAKQQTTAGRAKLLDMLFFMACSTTLSVDTRKEQTCFELASTLITDYYDNPDTQNAVLYPMLKCLAVYLYPSPADDDPWLLIFRQQILEWASELDAEGCWVGISETNAVQRLILMGMNSYMFLDQTHDNEIRRAHAVYCTLVSIEGATGVVAEGIADVAKAKLSAESIQFCGLLYDLAMQGNVYAADKQLSNDIATLLDRQLTLHPATSAEHLFCLSITADNLCNEITDAAQNTIMGNIQ